MLSSLRRTEVWSEAVSFRFSGSTQSRFEQRFLVRPFVFLFLLLSRAFGLNTHTHTKLSIVPSVVLKVWPMVVHIMETGLTTCGIMEGS